MKTDISRIKTRDKIATMYNTLKLYIVAKNKLWKGYKSKDNYKCTDQHSVHGGRGYVITAQRVVRVIQIRNTKKIQRSALSDTSVKL